MWDKMPKATLPENLSPTGTTEKKPPVQDEHPRSSDVDIRHPVSSLDNQESESDVGGDTMADTTMLDTAKPDTTKPDTAQLDTAKLDTGHSNIHKQSPPDFWKWTRIARTGLMRSITEPSGYTLPNPVTPAPHVARETHVAGSLDDFSLFSSTSTSPGDFPRHHEIIDGRIEGLGISHTSIDAILFSQTKRSSDDLVGASSSINGTPSPNNLRTRDATLDDSDTSSPTTPTPKRSFITNASQASPDNTKLARRIRNDGEASPSVKPSTYTHKKSRTPLQGSREYTSSPPATPSPRPPRSKAVSRTVHDIPENITTEPSTPSSLPRQKSASATMHDSPQHNTSTSRHIPVYKVALASHLLPLAKSSVS